MPGSESRPPQSLYEGMKGTIENEVAVQDDKEDEDEDEASDEDQEEHQGQGETMLKRNKTVTTENVQRDFKAAERLQVENKPRNIGGPRRLSNHKLPSSKGKQKAQTRHEQSVRSDFETAE